MTVISNYFGLVYLHIFLLSPSLVSGQSTVSALGAASGLFLADNFYQKLSGITCVPHINRQYKYYLFIKKKVNLKSFFL